MNEITKLYENANIKVKEYCDRDSDACMNCCPEWKNRQNCWKYKSAMPPFTAEKQLELFKWMLKNSYNVPIVVLNHGYTLWNGQQVFEEALAEIINDLWQDLTEEERKQIKEILE